MADWDSVELPQTEALLFILVENSAKISAPVMDMVNKAMETLMPELSRWKRYDIVVKVAALAFSSEAHWITKGPVEAGQFQWNNLTPQGESNFGAACSKLYDKLSNTPLMEKLCGKYTPVIIMISNGNYDYELEKPVSILTHDDDLVEPLSLLWENRYFRNAWKLCFAVGEKANVNTLINFAGVPEAVEVITESDGCKNNPETGDRYEITARINGLVEKRYFIDDWFPGQWEGLQRDYGVADWRMS